MKQLEKFLFYNPKQLEDITKIQNIGSKEINYK